MLLFSVLTILMTLGEVKTLSDLRFGDSYRHKVVFGALFFIIQGLVVEVFRKICNLDKRLVRHYFFPLI